MCLLNITSRKNNQNLGIYLFLCVAVAIYSLSGFFTKLASGFAYLSKAYLLCLCSAIFVLAIYAVLWQMILKVIPLNQAYPFRSLGLVYSLLIACLAFHEEITIHNLVGSAMVLCGLLVLLIEKRKIQ